MEPSLAKSVKGLEIEVPRAKILLVDDNVDGLQSMAAVLESLNEEVLTASSANEALRHLLKHDPAVMLLDVMMPVMDGFQLAELIRQRERFRSTPIIFLTGLGKEDRQMLQGYRVGAVDYILKPCDPEILRYKVKVFVDLAKKNEMLRHYAAVAHSNSLKLQDALASTLKANAELEREIAERKRIACARDRLAGQLGAMPDFVEAMAEGAVTLATDGTVLYCNSRFGEIVGMAPEDIVQMPISFYLSADSQRIFTALFAESAEKRANAELQLQSREGTEVPVHVALSRFRTADIEAVAMVVTDLRDQKRNEEIVAQGRLARLILQYSHSGIAICDETGRIMLASAALTDACGCNPLFKPLDEVLPMHLERDGGVHQVTIRDLASEMQLTNVEVSLKRSDGTTASMLLSARPIANAGEPGLGFLLTLTDISERKLIEDTLRRSEKLAAAGRIAGALAHEINNPLAAVTNALYLLEHNHSLDAAARHFLQLATSELARVSHITRNTLSFYRESTAPAPINICDATDSVLELYEQQIERKKVRVRRRYDYKGDVVGYPVELRQVLGNLIINALDALSESGELALHIRSSVNRSTGQRGVRIIIGDTGGGVSQGDKHRLFEPFFTTKGEKGTGLGLWVTMGIVQKQGGTIRVWSSNRPGRSGTAFSVFLPLPDDRSHSAPNTSVPVMAGNNGIDRNAA